MKYACDDPDRAILAIEALMLALARDPRCREMYLSWAHPIRETYNRQRHEHPAIPSGAVFAVALHRDVSGDLELLERFIAEDLNLSYLWLAPTLLNVFQTRLIEEASGADMELSFQKSTIDATRRPGEKQRDYVRRLTRIDGPPPGRRRVKNEGTHIARDVNWLYRAKIKQPSDTVYSLAQEYAKVENRQTPAVSVVQNGIKRAEQILSSVSTKNRLAWGGIYLNKRPAK